MSLPTTRRLSEQEKLQDTWNITPILSPGKKYRKVNDLSELNAGDHIAVYRGLYYHHGVYIGDGQVIDFSQEGAQQRSYADFKDGYPVYVILHEKTLTVRDILANARKALEHYKEQYNVLLNNCEKFVTSIVTGEGFSLQVERAANAALVVGGIALVGGLLYAAFSGNGEQEKEKKIKSRSLYQ